MAYTALYREWRPQSFDDVVGQSHVTRTLRNALSGGRLGHAYLLSGPRGTGKTTIAKILAKAANCRKAPAPEPCNDCDSCRRISQGLSMDVIEIDAASNRGIDEIRDLREKVKYSPAETKYKVYIIDEVHMLTPEAFNALLKTLEEPPAHVIFILATTEPHKIPLTITSRCQRFDFHRLSVQEIVSRLKEVCQKHGLDVEAAALNLVARQAEGAMRDALSLLDQVMAFCDRGQVTLEDTLLVLGSAPGEILQCIAAAVARGDTGRCLQLVEEISLQGKDLRQFTRDLLGHFRNLLLCRISGSSDSFAQDSDLPMSELAALASLFSENDLTSVIRALAQLESDLRWATQPRLLLEVALIRLASGRAVADSPGPTAVRAEPKPENLVVPGESGEVKPAAGRRSEAPTRKPPLHKEDTPEQAASGSDQFSGIKSLWPKVLELVKNKSRPTEALLREAEPLALRGDLLILSVPYPFHKMRLEGEEQRKLIEKTLEQAGFPGLTIKLEISAPDSSPGESDRKKQAADPLSDPEIRRIMEVFPGEVLEIREDDT